MKDIAPTRGASQASQHFSKKQSAIALAIMNQSNTYRLFV